MLKQDWLMSGIIDPQAAAFGRLCVETVQVSVSLVGFLAAAFGRLCVETKEHNPVFTLSKGSRLRAAVC